MDDVLKRTLLDDTQDPARVLDNVPLCNAQEERERACHWIRVAAQQLQAAEYLYATLLNVNEITTSDRIVAVLEELLINDRIDDVNAFLTVQNAQILPLDAVTCIITATFVVRERLLRRESFIDAACERFKDDYPQLPEIYERMRCSSENTTR